jgi:YVTN family beta-propeller protein
MKRFFIVFLLLASLAARALPAQPDTLPETLPDTLVVLTKSEFRVSLIDPATGNVLAKLPTGHGPHEVSVSPDGRTAYVSNFGPFGHYPAGDQTHTQPGNTITVIDIVSRAVKTTWDLGTHTGPHGLLISHDGKSVWVTTETPQSLLELDAATGKIVHVWPTTQQRTHLIVITPDEKKFYATNTISGSVSVIDRAAGTTKVLPTGPGSEGIAISPDGREVWVSARAADKVAVISTVTDEILATFESGGKSPSRLHFTSDGKEVWVSNSASNQMAVFGAGDHKILATVDMPKGPSGMVFSADGRRLYVANMRDNEVTVIDVAARKVASRIPTGIDSEPDGLAWASNR